MAQGSFPSLNIFFSGPGSVGKTTLVQELSKYVRMELSPEIARGIIDQWKWTPDDYYPSRNKENFKLLNMEVMRRSMDVVKSLENKNVIFDRGLDYLIYLRYYNGEDSYKEAKDSPHSEYIAERCRKGVVFIIYPHPKCNKSDSIRLEPKIAEQVEFTEIMINVFDDFKVPYVPILCLNLTTRVELVVKEIVKRNADLLTDLGRKLIYDTSE